MDKNLPNNQQEPKQEQSNKVNRRKKRKGCGCGKKK